MTASNASPFSPVVRIHPGGNPIDADTWGVGYDISQWVLYPSAEGGQAITYSAGRPDEATRVDAGEMKLTLNNRDGRFSTKNPEGPYYPSLRRGTPITLSMVSGEDTFNRTAVPSGGWGTSTSGQVWTTTGTLSRYSTDGTKGLWTTETTNLFNHMVLTGSNTLNGSVRFTCHVPVVATGASLVFGAVLRRSDNSNYLMMKCSFGLAGAVTATISRSVAGVLSDLASAGAGFTYAANDKLRVVGQTDGATVRMKIWKPANPADPDADEPDAWTVTAEESTLSGSEAGIALWRVSGNTNASPLVFYIDDVSISATEFTGTVVRWPLRWNKRSTNSWAPIQAAGILGRLKQGTPALKSPLARQLPAYNPTGYWPLEDGPDATSFGSAVTGVAAAARSTPPITATPAADTSLPGASQSPVFAAATASIRGDTPRRQTGTGFSAMFLAKLSALPAAATKVASFKGSGRVSTWNIYIDNVPNITVEGIETDGTVTVNTINSFPSEVDPLEWTAYQLETEWDGATLSWANLILHVGDDTYYAQSGSFATGQPARVWWFQLGGGLSDLSGAAFAHVWLGENTLPFHSATFTNVSNGWRGELASDRIARLCAEENIPVQVEAGGSEALGPQRTGGLVDVLYSAAEADYGILYEAGNGLGYRPRSARYQRGLSFVLSVAAGDIDQPPEGEDDTQRVRNDWTVSRDNGANVQVIDQDHIDVEGRWPDSATINVEADDVLPDHAAWRVYLGTRDDLRWPNLSFNFARQSTLIPAWRATPYGFRVQVTTGLDQVIGSDPDVYVEGYTATLWPHGWTVELACSSAAPWDIPVLDDPEFRIDAGACTLAEALDTTETGIDVTTTDGFPWAATAELAGAVLEIGGETMTVVSVSGAGANQTITVTRSTNGVVKEHAIGDAVGLANPTYLAL